MPNPIEVAVMPLKEAALERAATEAAAVIGRVKAKLEEAGWNRDAVAPYPKSWNVSREEFHKNLGKYRLFCALTKLANSKTCRRPNEPCIVEMSEEGIARFIKDAKENAATAYDLYVAKLVHKIGETTEAKLEGNHVWGKSYLHVVTAAGSKECWKTQTIINVSKLGKLFNQFPTRKVKA